MISSPHLAFDGLASFVREHVLTRPERYEWSLQGFGMLRTYVSRELRLHVWDDRFRVKDVSDIHDHPWSFESLVLSGELTNIRYEAFRNFTEPTHHEGTITCGPDTAIRTATTIEPDVALMESWRDVVLPGAIYKQDADDVHRTDAMRGTVTLVARSWTNKDPERALVYWPIGTSWISAHPRPASPEEAAEICAYARERWRFS